MEMTGSTSVSGNKDFYQFLWLNEKPHERQPKTSDNLGAVEYPFTDARVLIRLIEDQNSAHYTYVINETPPKPNEQTEALSVEDMIVKILNVFGLNKSQIADLIGISRASLYNHANGAESPTDLSKYCYYYDLANTVEHECTDLSLLHRGLKTVTINGSTLLRHLKSNELQKVTLVEMCKIIVEKVSRRRQLTQKEKEVRRGMSHNQINKR